MMKSLATAAAIGRAVIEFRSEQRGLQKALARNTDWACRDVKDRQVAYLQSAIALDKAFQHGNAT